MILRGNIGSRSHRVPGKPGHRPLRSGPGSGFNGDPGCRSRFEGRIRPGRFRSRSLRPSGPGFSVRQRLRTGCAGRGGTGKIDLLGCGAVLGRRLLKRRRINRVGQRHGGPRSGNRCLGTERNRRRIRQVGGGRNGAPRSGTPTFRKRCGFQRFNRRRDGGFSDRFHLRVGTRPGGTLNGRHGMRLRGGLRRETLDNRACGRRGTGREKVLFGNRRAREADIWGRRRSCRNRAGPEGNLEKLAEIRPRSTAGFGWRRGGGGECVDRVLRRNEGEGVRAGKAGRGHFLAVLCIRRRRRVSSAARFTPSLPTLDIASRTPATTSSFIR